MDKATFIAAFNRSAGSQYAEHGQRCIAANLPAEVRAYAEAVLAEVRWRPDPTFMVDVCESGSGLWLVELNSFSGSWFYRCDLAAVVTEASELARHANEQRQA